MTTDLKCPRCSIPLREHGTAAERYQDIEHVMRCMVEQQHLPIVAVADGIAALGLLAEKAKA